MKKKQLLEFASLLFDYEKEIFEGKCIRAFYFLGPEIVKKQNTIKSRTALLRLINSEVEEKIKSKYPEELFFKEVFEDVSWRYGMEFPVNLPNGLSKSVIYDEVEYEGEF